MKAEIAHRLRGEYEYLWHDSMRELPDGWTEPLVVMLEKMYRLSTVGPSNFMSPGIINWCQVRVEVYMASAMAFASPMMPASKWHPERALACIQALSEFHSMTQETCEICGNPGASDGQGSVRCIGCAGQTAIAAEEADRAKALYDECRILFPAIHGKSIDLNVPDYLFELLAKCLREIKDIVIDEDGYLAGKVQITRVEMIDDQIHVRHVYNQMPAGAVAAMIDIDDTIRFLEAQADELTRRQQNGGSNAST